MGNVQNAFKYNRARKNVIIGGAVILICLTALSCVSSFMIYRGGFGDMPFIFQQALALGAVRAILRAHQTTVLSSLAPTSDANPQKNTSAQR